MPGKASTKFVRRNVTIPEDFDKRLEELKDDYGLASVSELFRFAVNKLAEAGHPAFKNKPRKAERAHDRSMSPVE